jgi:hypothetical protein
MYFRNVGKQNLTIQKFVRGFMGNGRSWKTLVRDFGTVHTPWLDRAGVRAANMKFIDVFL